MVWDGEVLKGHDASYVTFRYERPLLNKEREDKFLNDVVNPGDPKYPNITWFCTTDAKGKYYLVSICKSLQNKDKTTYFTHCRYKAITTVEDLHEPLEDSLFLPFATEADFYKVCREEKEECVLHPGWNPNSVSVSPSQKRTIDDLEKNADALAKLACWSYYKKAIGSPDPLLIEVPGSYQATPETYLNFCRKVMFQIVRCIPYGLRRFLRFSTNPSGDKLSEVCAGFIPRGTRMNGATITDISASGLSNYPGGLKEEFIKLIEEAAKKSGSDAFLRQVYDKVEQGETVDYLEEKLYVNYSQALHRALTPELFKEQIQVIQKNDNGMTRSFLDTSLSRLSEKNLTLGDVIKKDDEFEKSASLSEVLSVLEKYTLAFEMNYGKTGRKETMDREWTDAVLQKIEERAWQFVKLDRYVSDLSVFRNAEDDQSKTSKELPGLEGWRLLDPQSRENHYRNIRQIYKVEREKMFFGWKQKLIAYIGKNDWESCKQTVEQMRQEFKPEELEQRNDLGKELTVAIKMWTPKGDGASTLDDLLSLLSVMNYISPLMTKAEEKGNTQSDRDAIQSNWITIQRYLLDKCYRKAETASLEQLNEYITGMEYYKQGTPGFAKDKLRAWESLDGTLRQQHLDTLRNRSKELQRARDVENRKKEENKKEIEDLKLRIDTAVKYEQPGVVAVKLNQLEKYTVEEQKKIGQDIADKAIDYWQRERKNQLDETDKDILKGLRSRLKGEGAQRSLSSYAEHLASVEQQRRKQHERSEKRMGQQTQPQTGDYAAGQAARPQTKDSASWKRANPDQLTGFYDYLCVIYRSGRNDEDAEYRLWKNLNRNPGPDQSFEEFYNDFRLFIKADVCAYASNDKKDVLLWDSFKSFVSKYKMGIWLTGKEGLEQIEAQIIDYVSLCLIFKQQYGETVDDLHVWYFDSKRDGYSSKTFEISIAAKIIGYLESVRNGKAPGTMTGNMREFLQLLRDNRVIEETLATCLFGTASATAQRNSARKNMETTENRTEYRSKEVSAHTSESYDDRSQPVFKPWKIIVSVIVAVLAICLVLFFIHHHFFQKPSEAETGLSIESEGIQSSYSDAETVVPEIPSEDATGPSMGMKHPNSDNKPKLEEPFDNKEELEQEMKYLKGLIGQEDLKETPLPVETEIPN